MRIDFLKKLVSPSQIPKHFQVGVEIVTEEDMSLSEEVLVRVIVEHLTYPVNHLLGNLWLLKVFIEWIHTVQAQNHDVRC